MRILVCGGREYANYARLSEVLTEIVSAYPSDQAIIIEGGARGADDMAHTWAHRCNIHKARVVALWDKLGSKAGTVRNEVMLLLQPDLVVAFPGGRGTRNMVSAANKKGVDVMKIDWE